MHRKSRRRRQFEDASFSRKTIRIKHHHNSSVLRPCMTKSRICFNETGQRQSRERRLGRRRQEKYRNREPFWSESLLHQKKILTTAERIVVTSFTWSWTPTANHQSHSGTCEHAHPRVPQICKLPQSGTGSEHRYTGPQPKSQW